MTASSVDTAELPLTEVPRDPAVPAGSPVIGQSAAVLLDGSSSPGTPSVAGMPPSHVRGGPVTATEGVASGRRRADLFAKRRQERRERRLIAAAGLAGMGAVLGATVVVLGVVR
jgi:hypothetical protein